MPPFIKHGRTFIKVKIIFRLRRAVKADRGIRWWYPSETYYPVSPYTGSLDCNLASMAAKIVPHTSHIASMHGRKSKERTMIKIDFKTNNAAFEDPAEAGRILRMVATQIDAGMASDEYFKLVNMW